MNYNAPIKLTVYRVNGSYYEARLETDRDGAFDEGVMIGEGPTHADACRDALNAIPDIKRLVADAVSREKRRAEKHGESKPTAGARSGKGKGK